MPFDTIDFPGGASVYREYAVRLSDGSNATIAFTLGDPDIDPEQAAVADELGGVAYGLVSLSGYPDGPSQPLFWMHTKTKFGIVVAAQDDEDLGEAVSVVICLYARTFFADLAPYAPELSALHERVSAGLLLN